MGTRKTAFLAQKFLSLVLDLVIIVDIELESGSMC